MSYRSGPCPRCDGSGFYSAVVCGIRSDGGRFSEVRRLPCATCRSSGRISEQRAAAMNAGERMRQDRIRRGISQREEAARLGITPQELSRRELGEQELGE